MQAHGNLTASFVLHSERGLHPSPLSLLSFFGIYKQMAFLLIGMGDNLLLAPFKAKLSCLDVLFVVYAELIVYSFSQRAR